MSVLSIDFETRATVDLRQTGVYPYAQHPETDIWCMAWAFDDEEPEIWTPADVEVTPNGWQASAGLPHRITQHIFAGGEIRAWNAQFERIIWNEIMVKRYSAPAVRLEQWVCTAAEAAAMSLPRSLDQAATVCKVAEKKDTEGYALMMRMTRPRSVKDGKIVWWDVEDRKQRLYEYCKQDVRTERALAKALHRLVPGEREIYLLDQRINDRGIHLDRELVLAAKDIVDEGLARANAVLEQLTGGAATTVTKVGQIKTWLGEQGVETESLDKAAVQELLSSDLSPEVRQVIELRAEAGRSSVAKLDAMLAAVSEGDQLRGLALYHGATTGRWTGKLVQPHNFPRGDFKDPESFIPDVLAGRYEHLDLIAHPVSIISSLLRSMLTARPGYHLVSADYSGIEMRVLNWFAQQQDILALLERGEDVYSYNAARMTGTPYEPGTKHPQRQGGKFQELGCGFQMGWKTAKRQAATPQYGLILTDEQAKEIVDHYRATHDKVKAFWGDAQTAALEAVAAPGSVVTFGALRNLKFTKQGAYLYLILPSKRALVYAAPEIVDEVKPWGKTEETVKFWAVDGYTKKWEQHSAYGGLWVENIVQAAARDIMAEGMKRVEAAGYEIVLTVHDEVVAEIPEDWDDGAQPTFEILLATNPTWAAGCPIATEGWRGFRYRK